MNQFELDLEWKAKLTNVTIRVIETTIFLMSVNELVTKVEFATEQHSGKKNFLDKMLFMRVTFQIIKV